MKLIRVGEAGKERPGVLLDEHTWLDLADLVADYDEDFFADDGIARIRTHLGTADLSLARPLQGQRIGAPIARPHQILCIGLNYSDHAKETGQSVPTEPILFTKSPNTLVGPDDNIIHPRGATKLDWEVELGVVIGSRTSSLDSIEQAADHIAGYVVVNDVSERAFQLERGGQWTKGKSCETFNPAGPWLVTPDEVDVSDLHMWLHVNGSERQNGSTSTMVFSPAFIVHYLSQFMVLEPGDLINTGTPPGVGMGHNPSIWLHPGDVMELGIQGLGTQRQVVVDRAGT